MIKRKPYKPIADHDYHRKTDAELFFIMRDAAEAAAAMRGMDAAAESKYLDQINDAATVIGYRRRVATPVPVRESDAWTDPRDRAPPGMDQSTYDKFYKAGG